MLNSNAQKNANLFKVDARIDELVKRIELLNYVNPINVDSQKEKFFNSKYLTDPCFDYPKRDFSTLNLHREFFKLSINAIEDRLLRDFYEELIYFYSSLIQCIETIGKGRKFYYNSLRSFGTPTEQDVENAKFILHLKSEDDSLAQFQPKYTAEQSIPFFKDYSTKHDFTYQIKQSSTIGAIAMVSNHIKSLILDKNHIFSENELKILMHHEIGVHMVTTMNGLRHPLKVFSHGFPNNEETQEGLAVFSEYMSGNLTIKRLKELSYRVIAVDSLAKGYSFSKTFRLLHNTYDMEKEQAFYITMRAHRGGGFTKDYLYLSGLKKIYDYHKEGKDLSILLTGKVSLEFLDHLKYMLESNYAISNKHMNPSLFLNKNTNKTVDFILQNLR